MCGRPSFPPRPVCPRCLAQAANVADTGGSFTADPIAIDQFAPLFTARLQMPR